MCNRRVLDFRGFNEMGNLPGGVWVAYLVGDFSFIGWLQVETSQFLRICGSVY